VAAVSMPPVARERGLYVPDRAHAMPWLPELTRDLMRRDVAAWALSFGFSMPPTQGPTSNMYRTLWTAPVVLPDFGLDRDSQNPELADASIFGWPARAMVKVPLEVETVVSGSGGPDSPSTLVLVDPLPDQINVPVAAFGGVPSGSDEWIQTADRTLTAWVPRGTVYVHVLACGSARFSMEDPGTTSLIVGRGGLADCGFRVETAEG